MLFGVVVVIEVFFWIEVMVWLVKLEWMLMCLVVRVVEMGYGVLILLVMVVMRLLVKFFCIGICWVERRLLSLFLLVMFI